MNVDTYLYLFVIAWPLGLALGLLARRDPPAPLLWLAATAALPALVLAVVGRPMGTVSLPWLLLDLRLGLDDIGQTFLLFTALLWLLAGIYALGQLAADPRRRRFFVFFLLTLSGNVGLILAQDMAGFYLFFGLMSFASYGMIVHDGDPDARRAGRVYLTLAVLGELLLFAGMLLAAHTRGSLSFDTGVEEFIASPARDVAVALLLVGFAVKVGIVTLHMSVPLAYPAAPIPASAVISGALSKAGLLGWMRFLPLGEAALPGWGNLCLAAGMITAFYGVAVGLTQQNAKTVLAYSSISQMGLITLAIGQAMVEPAYWPTTSATILIFALHHGLNKACLFLGVGVAEDIGARTWRRRLVQLGLLLPALALAGAPLTIGAVAKASLKDTLHHLPNASADALALPLPLSSVATTLLMARFLYLAWPRGDDSPQQSHRVKWLTWLALLAAIAGAIWLVPASHRACGWDTLAATAMWSNTWPVLLGTAVAGFVGLLAVRLPWKLYPAIPAGDVLVPLVWGAEALRRFGRRGWQERRPGSRSDFASFIKRIAHQSHAADLARHTEATLTDWPAVGAVFLLFAMVLAAVILAS